jgi:hypothetical protein
MFKWTNPPVWDKMPRRGTPKLEVSKEQYWDGGIKCPHCNRVNDVTEGSSEMLGDHKYRFDCGYCLKPTIVTIKH